MNLICMLGLFPYLYYGIMNKSIVLGVIFFNGICFHYNNNNYILKYYDIFVNFSFFLYYSYLLGFTYYSFVGMLSYPLNCLAYNKSYISYDISNVCHIVFSQWFFLKHILIVFKY